MVFIIVILLSPPQPPSGRTEKQTVRDVLANNRSPPQFKRTPSRRQPRRLFDELLTAEQNSKMTSGAQRGKNEVKSISIPQPAQA